MDQYSDQDSERSDASVDVYVDEYGYNQHNPRQHGRDPIELRDLAPPRIGVIMVDFILVFVMKVLQGTAFVVMQLVDVAVKDPGCMIAPCGKTNTVE